MLKFTETSSLLAVALLAGCTTTEVVTYSNECTWYEEHHPSRKDGEVPLPTRQWIAQMNSEFTENCP